MITMWKVIVVLHFVQDMMSFTQSINLSTSKIYLHHFLSQLETAHSDIRGFKKPWLCVGFLKSQRSLWCVSNK